jgi:hypothetical protein
MKIDYTLPGVLPGIDAKPSTDVARPSESFGSRLKRLRTPETANWRSVLRLDASPEGATSIGPPPIPLGVEARDGVSQRAWWRAMLDKHTRLTGGAAAATEAPDHAAVRRMLAYLLEGQRLEDQMLARHLAEGTD